MWQLIYGGGIVYAFGSLTWANFLPGGIPASALIPNLVALGLGILIALFPYGVIYSCLFRNREQEALVYKDVRLFLPSEYDRLNPTTA